MSALADLTLALNGLIAREVAHAAPAEFRAEVEALEHAEREMLLRRWLLAYRL